jgi:hypothetical protein
MLSPYLGGSADLLRIDDVLLTLPRLLSPLSLLIPFDPASLVAHCLCSARLAFLFPFLLPLRSTQPALFPRHHRVRRTLNSASVDLVRGLAKFGLLREEVKA